MRNKNLTKKNMQTLKGYLYKKSPNIFNVFDPWQKRYVILENKKMTYYEDENDLQNPKGVINFDMF